MILFSVIFISILVIINYYNYNFNIRQQIRSFQRISNKVGIDVFCTPDTDNPRLEDWNYGTVLIKNMEELTVAVNRLSDISDDELTQHAKKIYAIHSYSGQFHSLVYVRKYFHGDTAIIFLSNDYALENSRNLLITSIVVGIAGLVLLFLISLCIARWLTAPVADSIETQKRFVSDAGHELKTPLTIIGANLDLLEDEFGDQKQFQYIRSETSRMTVLVNELLTLARIGNTSPTSGFQKFCLSEALMGIALPFESLAYENHIQFRIDIEDSISMYGNHDQMQKLLSILLDNAFRYTSPGGSVCVRAASSHKKIRLSVSNTGEPIPEEIRGRIFQRFYRGNESRSTTAARRSRRISWYFLTFPLFSSR